MYSLLVSYIKSRKTPLSYSTIINIEDNTWMIESSSGNVKNFLYAIMKRQIRVSSAMPPFKEHQMLS